MCNSGYATMKAAAELVEQLNQTSENVAVDETCNIEKKGIGYFTIFPWLPVTLRSCREVLGTRNPKRLDGLLYNFVKEVSFSVKDCYSRPNRAAKLRSVVHEILVFFDMLYEDLKDEYVGNTDTYLHLMSDLLSVYLDLEIKVSKRGVDSLRKIGQLMTSALYTYLARSEDHIVEAILKAKLITKSTGELCAPVLHKILKESNCFIVDEHAYVRFLLGFKLLHKITKKSDRRLITKMAMRKLDPPPELIENIKKMNNIFPLMNTVKEPITEYLMNADFDFIKAKLEFLKVSNINNSSVPEFYLDKSLGYNYNGTITNLLNTNNKKQECQNQLLSDNCWSIAGCGYSNDYEIDPNDYRISLNPTVIPVNEESEDDNSEVEFLGTQNKLEKPVVLVTLDSDEDTANSQKKDNIAEPEITKDKESVTDTEAVTSSLDFISSTTDQVTDDSFVTKDCEISSTLEHIIENLDEYTNYPVMKDSQEKRDLLQQQKVKQLQPAPQNTVAPKENNLKDTETCSESVVIDNLDKLITTTTTKKVKYENVVKSYKIVKSNRLKNPRQNSQVKDGSDIKPCKSPPKFIKIDQSGYIGGNLKDGLKWVSRNIDVRKEAEISSLSFQSVKSRDYRVVSGEVGSGNNEQKSAGNVGNRVARTSQCVPIIFKKLSDETSKECKRRPALPKNQRITNSKSSGRKVKSNSKTHIKTDINMKSTLKHINPDSIPQFASDAGKDKKRKCAEDPKIDGNKVVCMSSSNVFETKTVEFKSVSVDKVFKPRSNFSELGYQKSSGSRTTGSEGVVKESSPSLPYSQQMNTPYYPVQSDRANSYLSAPQVDTTVDSVDLSYRNENFNQFSQTHSNELVSPSFYSKKVTFMSYQNEEHRLNPFEKFIVNDNVQKSPLTVHLKVSNSIREESRIDQPVPFEARNFPVYCNADTTTHLPVVSCEGLSELSGKEEVGNDSIGSTNEEEVVDLVNRQDRFMEVSDNSSNNDRISSVEVGMSSSGVRCSTKRDLIISERVPEEELRYLDEEFKDFCEPWEGPRDYFPDDEEYILRALPDHQNLFSEEDFTSHLFDGAFPPPNFNLESVLSEDMDITVFDDKCLYDLKGNPELEGPSCQNMSSENFFAENNSRSLDSDVGDNQPASCKKSPNKPKTYKEVDERKLRSDSVVYHTRSISQKGIPIEYTLASPKRVRKKKSRNSETGRET